MNREGTRQHTEEHGPQNVPSIPEVMNQYNSLSREKQAVNHGRLLHALDNAVVKAATDYANSKGIEEQKDFSMVLRHLGDLRAPAPVLAELTKISAERTFGDANISPDLRSAYASVLLQVGGDSLFNERAQQIADAHSAAYKERGKSPSAEMRVHIAEQLLAKMDIVVTHEEIPSKAETVKEWAGNNSRKIAVAGTGAVVASSIVFGGAGAAFATANPAAAPTVGGGGASTAAVQMTGNTPENSALAASPTPGVGISVNLDTKTAAIQFSGSEAQAPATLQHAVAAPRAVKSEAAVAMTDTSTESKPNVNMQSVVAVGNLSAVQGADAEAVIFAAPTNGTKEASVAPALIAPDIMPIAPAQNGSVTGDTDNAQPSTSPDVEASYNTTNDATEVSIPTPTAVSMNATPTAVPVETTTTNPDGTEAKLTKQQKIVAGIKNSIVTGNAENAANMIVANYHDKSAPATNFDAKGNPVVPITNQTLLDNLTQDPDASVEAKTLAAIHGEAHSDPNYTQNIIAALSVIEAAAHDQTVLDSPDVQGLIANVKRPDGQYQGKLFDQYMQKGTDQLTTKDGNGKTLIDGFTDAHTKTIETLYGYVLMGQVSDSDQQTQETAMQKADEVAATEAKAAAAEAANQAQTDVEKIAADPNQLLQTAINQAAAANGWSNGEKTILLTAAQNGASAAAVAGLGGNVFAESGFDPGKQEYGSGIGFGYIQESYGRRTTMENAAAAAGVNVADPNWQANYVVNESKGRAQRNNPGANEWAGFVGQTDPVAAADYWLWNNERAGTPHAPVREAKAQELFNQINDQVNSIKQAAAAAAAARAQAAAAAAAAEKAKEAQEAAAAAAAEQAKHSLNQQTLANAEAALAQWQNGTYRPMRNQAGGTHTYLDYSHGVQTNWCADFVSTMVQQAGVDVYQPVVGDLRNALLATGKYTWHDAGGYVPQPGDIAFYGGSNANTRGMGHINIVVSATGPLNYVSIGGNEGNTNAPSYAGAYGGIKAYATAPAYNNSYVMEEGGSVFGEPVSGFLSAN